MAIASATEARGAVGEGFRGNSLSFASIALAHDLSTPAKVESPASFEQLSVLRVLHLLEGEHIRQGLRPLGSCTDDLI